MHLSMFLLCLPAFGCLALAMERHQHHLWGRPLQAAASRRLRGLAWTLLCAALWLSVHRQGWTMSLVAFSGHSSLAAGLVFCVLLAWHRRGSRRLQDSAQANHQAPSLDPAGPTQGVSVPD